MERVSYSLILLLLSSLAWGQQLSWQAPEQNCDGSNRDPATIERYVILWGSESRGSAGLATEYPANTPCGQMVWPNALDSQIVRDRTSGDEFTYDGGIIDAGQVLTYDLMFSPGEYYITVYAQAAEDQSLSPVSNEVRKTIVGANAAPVIIETERTVYNVIKQPNRFVLLPIGTVPPGTPCDPNNMVNGHGAVPTDAVVWAPGSTVRPVVVVAQCDG